MIDSSYMLTLLIHSQASFHERLINETKKSKNVK